MTVKVERDCALQAWEINTVDDSGAIVRQTQIFDTELMGLIAEVRKEHPWLLDQSAGSDLVVISCLEHKKKFADHGCTCCWTCEVCGSRGCDNLATVFSLPAGSQPITGSLPIVFPVMVQMSL